MSAYRIFILLIISFFSIHVFAGEKYWVFFKDKKGVSFNPYAYFDERVIQKRLALGIDLVQESDLPLNRDYCEEISRYADISMESRWLNAVAVSLERSDVRRIENFDFVKEVRRMTLVSGKLSTNEEIDSTKLAHLHQQLEVLGASLFHEQDIDGEGVRIAVFDGGFPNVDKLDIFSHLFEEDKIVATWDFVNDREFVYDYNSHGTSVLACIAGVFDGQRFGLAPGAEFLLARTEVNTEIFAEEEYWAAAMEWADKKGADIISSSLGYTYHRYFPRQMDGKSVFVTRMANLAASKGMLVINSAGNDGDSDWEVISAPGDADSVLTVGGISDVEGLRISFSSYGPTYDGRLKPNVVAFGRVVTTGKNGLKTAYGTSFSTPLVTGFAACVMQLHPNWSNMKVFREIEKSGHLYPYYDYAHGYGVPQAAHFMQCKSKIEPTFSFLKKLNYLDIELKIGNGNASSLNHNGMKAQHFGHDHFYLYYHIASAKTGEIRRYRVVRMTEADSYSIDLDEIKRGEYVMAYYRGYTEKFQF